MKSNMGYIHKHHTYVLFFGFFVFVLYRGREVLILDIFMYGKNEKKKNEIKKKKLSNKF
jgi:hypothetical protein